MDVLAKSSSFFSFFFTLDYLSHAYFTLSDHSRGGKLWILKGYLL